jgi:hypothetical protein
VSHTFGRMHLRPQEPQLSLLSGVSQPSAIPKPEELQSWKPPEQVETLHWPRAHLSEATCEAAKVGGGYMAVQSTPLMPIVAFRQPPQLFGSPSVSISHPSSFCLLQSLKVPMHDPMAQVPSLAHVAVACEMKQGTQPWLAQP